MGKKFNIEFEGFETVINRLKSLDSDVKGVTAKALKETHRIVTKKAEEGVQKNSLPAKGRYSTGDTSKSLKRTAGVSWMGDTASVDVGFSIKKGGLASIFMMYGTPRYMKNAKLYNAFFGKSTTEEVRKTQEDIFYSELRKFDK